MSSRWVFISRIIDKSSQETYGSVFLASCCGFQVALVILPQLSGLADEVMGSHGLVAVLLKKHCSYVSPFIYMADTFYR